MKEFDGMMPGDLLEAGLKIGIEASCMVDPVEEF